MLTEITRDDANRLLRSCPGSGKTRAIVYKALACVDSVFETTRRVACITYTNAAVDEIEDRLASIGTSETAAYCEISTIHSFCLVNILSLHFHLLPQFKEAPPEIVTVESPWLKAIAEEIVRRHRLKTYALEQLANVHREPDGSIFIPDSVTAEAAAEFIERLDSEGKVVLGDIVYFANVLLSEYPYVARGLAARYAWILVDEFQDTSAAQVEILKRIFDWGVTKLFLVGDPNQSIFGFAGAKPELMDEIVRYTGASTDIQLLGNFRCSAKIVKVAERLCKADMKAVGPSRDCPMEPSYVDAPSVTDGILGVFIPALSRARIPVSGAAILAPQWFVLFHLSRMLRARGIPVFGPGARPYRRSLEFAQFAEHACAFAASNDPGIWRRSSRALYLMVLSLTGESHTWLFGYEGRKLLVQLMHTMKALYNTYPIAIQWLRHASEATAEVLVSANLLDTAAKTKLVASASAMVDLTQQNLIKEGSDPLSYQTDSLGMFARPDECLQLMTLHSAKGRQFDAVAIVDCHEGLIPHWSDKSQAGIAEACRLLYVGITRARQMVVLFTHAAQSAKAPSRFLGKGYLGMN